MIYRHSYQDLFAFRAAKTDLEAYISQTNIICEAGFWANIFKVMYFFTVCQTKINSVDIRYN